MIKHKGIKHNIINDAPFVGAIVIASTCHKNCPDCINEHLKNNTPIFHNSAKEIIDQVKNNPFDEGIILGGLEWTESPESMEKLVNQALKHNLEIIIYTHMKECKFKKRFPNLVDKNIWVKFGEYKKDYKSNNHFSYGVPLASKNQYIKKMGSDIMTRKFEKISFEQFEKDAKDGWQHFNLKNLYESIQLPKRATAKSAGYDFYTPVGFKLAPDETIKVPTGVKVYMKDDEVLKIHPRSSLGFKYHLRLSNSCGIVDSDYYNNPDNEGHIWIKLRNEGDETVTIQPNEAIAQGIFHKYLITDDDSFDGEEREGGIGSTN